MLQIIEENKNRFMEVLDRPSSFDKLKQSFISALNKNERLANCSEASLAGCFMKLAHLGLDLDSDTKEVYLVPYKREATVQIGYQGLIKLALSSGFVSNIDAKTVYSDDEFEIDLADNIIRKHKPGRSRLDATGFYAVVTMTSGEKRVHYMTMEQMIEQRKKSRSDQFWSAGFEQMAHKTCVIKVLKLIPKSQAGNLRALEMSEMSQGKSMGLLNAEDKDAAIDAEILS